MEKLQLKHIAAYLPYGLKFTIGYGKVFNLTSNHIFNNHTGLFKGLDNEAKPILRPLFDLTKEIDFNGKFVNVSNKLSMINYGFAGHRPPTGEQIIEKIRNRTLTFSDSSVLFEWHFDIFGLIGKGLAIDINTLK